MPLPKNVAGRYEVLSTLGEGGMGIVYLARDSVVQREVALKTIRDVPSQTALQLFRKECSVLAAMSHPNVVEIFDIGEFEDHEGIRKPYFVMPLLRGETLGCLIRNASRRLTLERSVEIILQTCRGLQAAHERGLVHRDLKPNNIFVLPDDSVKIIDFGVAHMADLAATMTVKGGTLLYMAPEQIEMKPASLSSDIFSLGVVAYEILTGRRPFAYATEPEVIEAILHHTPAPASEVNPSIPIIYSRILHKAMAKQPWHRFSSAREFAETLQKAQRNEPIEIFDASRLAPRLQRATKALEQGNLEFASEIVGELESAGEFDATLSGLRQRLDTARREKTLSHLLDSAHTCMEQEEFLLAQQKLEQVLQMDPQNATAMDMRKAIENRLNQHKVAGQCALAAVASVPSSVSGGAPQVPAAPAGPPLRATLILGPDRVKIPSVAAPVQPDAKIFEPAFLGKCTSQRQRWKWPVAAGLISLALAIGWPWPTPMDLRTNPPGATVRIDGVFRGQSNLRLKLRPGAHPVEFSKTGYLPSTHILRVRRWPAILWNAQARAVEFNLSPTSRSLSIRGGTPRAEVRIDGRAAGTVGADGSFFSGNVSPGRHEIELRAARYKPKRIQRMFQASATVVISGADACLEPSTGILHLSVAPADAVVTYARSGGKAQAAGGSDIELDEGVYTITARASGFAEQNQVVRVAAGQSKSVALRLRAQAAPAITMEAWVKEGWTRQGAWYAHRGGDIVLSPSQPVRGAIEFTALRRNRASGNSRIQWVVNYRDSRNYLLFAIDKKSFYRSEVAEGRKRELPKINLPVRPAGAELQYTFRIEIAGSSLRHFLQSGDRWISLNDMNLPESAVAGGGFGFYLPGDEELLISGFTYVPKP